MCAYIFSFLSGYCRRHHHHQSTSTIRFRLGFFSSLSFGLKSNNQIGERERGMEKQIKHHQASSTSSSYQACMTTTTTTTTRGTMVKSKLKQQQRQQQQKKTFGDFFFVFFSLRVIENLLLDKKK